jgi:hypothetical protein
VVLAKLGRVLLFCCSRSHSLCRSCVSLKEHGLFSGRLIHAVVETYCCQGSSRWVKDWWICNRVGGQIQCPISKLGINFNEDIPCLAWTRKGWYSCCFGCKGFWFLNRSVLIVDLYTILGYPSHLVDWHGTVWTQKRCQCLMSLLQEVYGTWSDSCWRYIHSPNFRPALIWAICNR